MNIIKKLKSKAKLLHSSAFLLIIFMPLLFLFLLLLLLLLLLFFFLYSEHPHQDMGRSSTKFPSFCLNVIRPRGRIRSPTIQSKPNSSHADFAEVKSGEGAQPGSVTRRKIMIVVDSSAEAKGAIQWVLSHTVQSQDIVILLHVTKPSKQVEDCSKEVASRAGEILNSMMNVFHLKRPEVQIEVALAEGNEKGPTIVEEARKHGVSLLVLGQRKRSIAWRLLMVWASNRVGGGAVEYCIQNAQCMAIAVRRKNKKLGGYLITTKRHKDFWLLA